MVQENALLKSLPRLFSAGLTLIILFSARASPAAPRLAFSPFFEPNDSAAHQSHLEEIGGGVIDFHRYLQFTGPGGTSNQSMTGSVIFSIVQVRDSTKTMGFVKGAGTISYHEDIDCGHSVCKATAAAEAKVTISGRFYGRGHCKIRITIVEKWDQPYLTNCVGPGCGADWSSVAPWPMVDRVSTVEFPLVKDASYKELFILGEGIYVHNYLFLRFPFLSDPVRSGCWVGDVLYPPTPPGGGIP